MTKPQKNGSISFIQTETINNSLTITILFTDLLPTTKYMLLSLFESGFIDKQTLIKELRTYTLVDQLLFHTPESLSKLVFIEAKEILL